MKWTNEELNNLSIIKRINDKADIIADQLILDREGYKLPSMASQWNSKQSKDYRFYFENVKSNIMSNSNIKINEEIRKDYQEYIEQKEKVINEVLEWEKSLIA